VSDIDGKGYGDKHDWRCRGTEQHSIPEYRSTFFSCKNCGENFRHYYHRTPDIFEQMKKSLVSEECKKESE
jgi:hypothetical protein